MQVIAKSDVGLVRHENQDTFRIKLQDDDTAIAIVCDGMGGENAGGEASEVAVSTIFDRIALSYRQEADNNSIRNLIFSSISAANSIVFEKSLNNSDKVGMGTTCVCSLIKNDIAYIASVGDSRAYLISDNTISQITNDHTYVRILYEQGKITEEELKNHPQKNVITKAVGIDERIEPDYFEINLPKKSVILICTDGLSNYCSDELICKIVSDSNNLELAASELITYAIDKGGKDNITVALTANYNE